VNPVKLQPNQLHHFYRGGGAIASFRGIPSTDDHAPEDWVGSTATMFGADRAGLSVLPDGRLLRDAIAADPVAYLGPAHTTQHGTDCALLVKLLDAGERLPVHFHPDHAFARSHLDLAHGKTEAWLILEARSGASVWVGFKHDIALATVREWMQAQASDEMLAAMHELPVKPGDVIFVPAGTPHAIGDGILIIELQEPTDLSINLEWTGFELTEGDSSLGLDWDTALQALDRSGWSEERLAATHGTELPAAADPYFRAERIKGGDRLDAGFSVVLATAGEGTLGDVSLQRGSAVLVPYAAGELQLQGDIEAIRCRPPAPESEEGEF
jgi:mannose-6-phosphate isomerase